MTNQELWQRAVEVMGKGVTLTETRELAPDMDPTLDPHITQVTLKITHPHYSPLEVSYLIHSKLLQECAMEFLERALLERARYLHAHPGLGSRRPEAEPEVLRKGSDSGA